MGLMRRLSMVFKSKASRALDKAEDPRETLDYSYERQLELLQQMRRGVTDVATSRKRVELQAEQLQANATKLEHNAARFDHRNPVINCSLPRTHAGFGRLACHRLVGENANPYLATTLDVSSNRAPRRFDLTTGNPGRLGSHESIIAEGYLAAASRDTTKITLVVLAIFHTLWQKHCCVPS